MNYLITIHFITTASSILLGLCYLRAKNVLPILLIRLQKFPSPCL